MELPLRLGLVKQVFSLSLKARERGLRLRDKIKTWVKQRACDSRTVVLAK